MDILEFDTINSTQLYAKELALQGKTDLIVCAKTQDTGVGRTGNRWVSPEGGLWFSFIIDRADIEFEAVEFITLILGVSVLSVCKKKYKTENLQLKWPNDLLINKKKIAGIICELVNNNKLVIGIGVNTNFKKDKLEELSENATTFESETNIEVNNQELLQNTIEEFKLNLQKEHKDIVAAFRENMAFINEKKYITSLKKEVIIKGISDKGYLEIEDEGIIREVVSAVLPF